MKAKNENGTVKIYGSLPTSYMIGRTNINLLKASIEIQQSEGFYEVVEVTPTEYQRILPLIPDDLVNEQYIQKVEDFTQEEKDKKDADKIKEDKRKEVFDTNTVIWSGLTPNGTEYALIIDDTGKLGTMEI